MFDVILSRSTLGVKAGIPDRCGTESCAIDTASLEREVTAAPKNAGRGPGVTVDSCFRRNDGLRLDCSQSRSTALSVRR